MNICFVCTGNACRSPFAECVTKKLLADVGMTADMDVTSMGTLDWGKNPRDAAMADVARQMGYEMEGTTTAMTRDGLMKADIIVVFEKHHRYDITKVLEYSLWDRIVMFDMAAFDKDDIVEDPHDQAAEVYLRVAKHIEEGCKRLVNEWRNYFSK